MSFPSAIVMHHDVSGQASGLAAAEAR